MCLATDAFSSSVFEPTMSITTSATKSAMSRALLSCFKQTVCGWYVCNVLLHIFSQKHFRSGAVTRSIRRWPRGDLGSTPRGSWSGTSPHYPPPHREAWPQHGCKAVPCWKELSWALACMRWVRFTWQCGMVHASEENVFDTNVISFLPHSASLFVALKIKA